MPEVSGYPHSYEWLFTLSGQLHRGHDHSPHIFIPGRSFLPLETALFPLVLPSFSPYPSIVPSILILISVHLHTSSSSCLLSSLSVLI